MKPTEANKPDESVLFSGTCVSDSGTVFNSLIQQIRELREERSNPHAPVQITAEKDMSALDKLIEEPTAYASLTRQIKDLIEDIRHPHSIETTATPVEVEEIWSKPQTGVPKIASVGVHVAIVVLLLIPDRKSS